MAGRSQALLAREFVIVEGPGRVAATLLVKAMIFFRRAPGRSLASFGSEFLRPGHPLLLPDAARPARLTRHVTIDLPGDPGASALSNRASMSPGP